MKVDHAVNKAASGSVTQYFIAKLTSDTQAALAAAATDKLAGVFLNSAATTERCDVQTEGVAEVKAGGSVTVGDLLTSDASGQAITATASAGSNVRVIGFALMGASSGDIFKVKLAPGSFQG